MAKKDDKKKNTSKKETKKQVVRACFELADCFTMSAKKDAIVNMGGLIGIRDWP